MQGSLFQIHVDGLFRATTDFVLDTQACVCEIYANVDEIRGLQHEVLLTLAVSVIYGV